MTGWTPQMDRTGQPDLGPGPLRGLGPAHARPPPGGHHLHGTADRRLRRLRAGQRRGPHHPQRRWRGHPRRVALVGAVAAQARHRRRGGGPAHRLRSPRLRRCRLPPRPGRRVRHRAALGRARLRRRRGVGAPAGRGAGGQPVGGGRRLGGRVRLRRRHRSAAAGVRGPPATEWAGHVGREGGCGSVARSRPGHHRPPHRDADRDTRLQRAQVLVAGQDLRCVGSSSRRMRTIV